MSYEVITEHLKDKKYPAVIKSWQLTGMHYRSISKYPEVLRVIHITRENALIKFIYYAGQKSWKNGTSLYIIER